VMLYTDLLQPAFMGGNEIFWLALVVIVLFGAGAIPKFARNLGRARSELEKGLSEGKGESVDEGKQQSSKQVQESAGGES